MSRLGAVGLQKSVAAVMRDTGPALGDLHWRVSTGFGRESKVVPEEAMDLVEAGRQARRLRQPGWAKEREQGRWTAKFLIDWAVKEVIGSRRKVEVQLDDVLDWERREKEERKMGDSLLRWLGFDKPPKQRVRHRTWRRQLLDTTRQLKLGADRARDKEVLELLDGVEVVRRLQPEELEAEGAGGEGDMGACLSEECVEGWDEAGWIREQEMEDEATGRHLEGMVKGQERALLEQPFEVGVTVKHSLWEMDELQAMNEVLGGTMQKEVDELVERERRQRAEEDAEAEEAWRMNQEGEVAERWELEEDATEGWNWGMRWLVQKEGKLEGSRMEQCATADATGLEERKEAAGSTLEEVLAEEEEGFWGGEPRVVRHSAWEADKLRAYNEILGGALQPEVDLVEESERLAASSGEEQEDEEWVAQLPGRRGGVQVGPCRKRKNTAPVKGAEGSGKQVAGDCYREGAGSSKVQRKSRKKREWYMEGFSENPGSAAQVEGEYTVGKVITQVVEDGTVGQGAWLGVELRMRGKMMTGWMQVGELKKKAADERGWRRRLRGAGREGWDVIAGGWVSSAGVIDADGAGKGNRGSGGAGAVLGWYLPVLVVEERISRAGVRLGVQMRRVAVGLTSGGYVQAVGIRSRREWCRYEMSRRDLTEITGELVQADGKSELLVEGHEIWREWGEQVEGAQGREMEAEWRRQKRQEWRAREGAGFEGRWMRHRERDQTYDRG